MKKEKGCVANEWNKNNTKKVGVERMKEKVERKENDKDE